MKKGQNQDRPSSVPLWENSYGARLRAQGNGPWPKQARKEKKK